MPHRQTDPPIFDKVARARRRYELLRTSLLVLLVLIVLASLVLGLLQGAKIQDLAEQNRAQAQQVALLLERQKAVDAERETVINRAIARIANEQRRALAAHDDRVELLLSRSLRLLNEEVNAPANRERRPLVFIGPTIPPAPAPTATPAPRPAPTPTCTQRGSKCR